MRRIGVLLRRNNMSVIISDPSQLAPEVVTLPKIRPGAVDGTRLSHYPFRLRRFRGRVGAGPIAGHVGLGIGDRVVSVVSLTTERDAVGDFAPEAPENGVLWQTSPADLSGESFLAVTVLPC